jgi:tRNA uridine 5-carboxymethylaminomethyl modification enzyme
MFRPGYAIEYDFFPPTQLKYSLETKLIQNLFFAGQINGTTGYEEAACQGLMAGINAHQKAFEKEALILKRSDAYIGVLIDDLISKGTQEPYRMFTSRAEFRTLLRQDNADLRLTELSYNLGLAKQERMDRVSTKKTSVDQIKKILKEISVEPGEINNWFEEIGSSPINEKQKAEKILLRPSVELADMAGVLHKLKSALSPFTADAIEQAAIQVKYDVYIEKERELVSRMSQLEELEIPETFDYKKIGSLGNEAREKLTRIRPRTLGQASRISGINPSDVQILMVFMGR